MTDREKIKQELIDLHRAYRRVFGSRRGFARRVLEDLEHRTGLNRTVFDPEGPNHGYVAAWLEGRRSIGLHIRYMLDPANFTDEALERRSAHGKER